MKGYGQFCPVAKALEWLERWTRLCARVASRRATFADIQRGVPLISRTLLAQRLKELEQDWPAGGDRGSRAWP
jgi:DNA-binding HxlR family transcriptional regulator